MAIQNLVKGELDWHEKMNANMKELDDNIGSANQTAGAAAQTASAANEAANSAAQAAAGKLDKPTDTSELGEGYVYQEADGSVTLHEGGGGKKGDDFKYTIIVDNGADGTPTAIEYSDDCYGFIEGNGSDLGDWANTKLIKEYFQPCLIETGDGAPKYFLQQDNMTLQESGEAAVTNGPDGDVMIRVKKLYGRFLKSGSRLKISLSNIKEDDSWFCFNDVAGEEKEYCYRGAMKAGVLAGATTVMRSISGVMPLVSQTRAVMRQYARNRGAGYHQNNPYLLFLWQLMYLLVYKNRDSQKALGQGRTLSSNTAAAQTGWSLSKPFCWGDQGGVNGVKFLGVEDFYGNVWEWVDGICSINQVFKLTRDPEKYNDDGTGYEISAPTGLTAAANSDKYITKVQGTNDLGFLPAASGGSSATYWCDNMWTADATQVVFFGGFWFSAAKAGAFCWNLSNAPSNSFAYIGSRLCRA